MAKGLNVKANLSLDTTQAKMQLKSLQKEITKLASNTGLSSLGGQTGLTSELTNAVKLTSQLQSALKGATNDLTGNLDLTKFNDSLRRTGTTLTDYQSTLRSLGADGAKAFNDLNKAILSAETPMLRTTEMAKETLTTLGNTVRWQATSSLIHGVMGAASQAMSYVQRLDKSLNSIQIVTGKSADTMSKFAKQANAAAKSLSTTTNEYAKAALIYYQQGLSDQQVAGRVETTLKLANVSGQTAAKVSDQMTSIWNNFYDGSKSLEYYADVMTALGASTATSSKEIAQGLSKFSSIAKTTGLSYEYATSALATITAATRQSADSVGTSLKTMFSRLQGLSLGDTLEDGTTLNKYSKALLAIGVNIKEANGQLKGMDSILNEIGNKWQTLNKDTQIALAQTVGGVRNYTSLMTLMNNWDQFRTNVGTARMASGTLQKQADIYADSWEAAQTRVRAASESIYKNLIDDKVFKGMTNNLASTLETVGKVTDAMGGFKGVLLSTAGVATQLFGGEISQALGNVGYNISSVLGGQKEVQALRQEALRNLLTPSNRLDTIIGDVETALNKNLVDRLTTYQEKVNKGQIAEWQTAAYQQLLQKAAEQDERTLAAVQAATQAETISSRYGYTFQQSLRTAANNISDATMKNAAEDFLQGSGKYKNAGGRQTYEALEDIAKTSIVLEELNSKYESAIPSEKGIASSTAAMKSLAGTILQLGSGAKELNISFQDLVGDKDTAIQLEHLYNNLNDFIAKTGPVTEQNLRKYQDFFEDRFGDFGNTLQKAIDNSAYGGQGFSNQLGELQSQLVSSFGMTAEQAASVVADVRARSEAVGESSLSRVMNIGASAESNKAIMDQLNANTRKHMDISQAVTDQIALFTSSAAAYGTVVQTLNTLTSGSASAMDRIVALGTSFGTLKSAMSAAGNVFSNFNSQIDIFGKSSPLTVGGLTAISGAAIGLVELGQSAIQAYQDTTVESQIRTLQNATVLAKEQASVAVETYNTLTAGAASYSALIDELYALKPGTADFANTLLAANDAALALTDKYGLTASRGAYGEIVFDSQELRERTKEYEQAAIEAQTRSLISSQYAQFFETAATYDRLNHTILWDSQNNIDTMKQDLSNQMKGLAGKMADSLGLNKGLLGNIGNSISSLFTNFTNQILIGADTLVADMTKAGFLDNQIYETYQNLRSGTNFKTEEALLNEHGLFTMDKLAQFYAEGIENGTFSSYQEFREKYKIGEATLGYVQPTDWSGLVESISEGGTGAIHWEEAKERLGQMLSNIAPQSLQSIIDGALGLGPNATDEDRQEAMQNFARTSENAQRKVEASIANMVSSVVAGGEDYTIRQQMAAAILGAGGYSTLSQIRPEDLETLQKQSPDVLRAQYKKLINPLTTDYLNYSSDELIAGIQAAQIEGKIKSAIDKIALGEITEEDLALARNYQNMPISELVNPENNTSFWGTFYAQQAANSISQLGEILIQSLTPEQLQQSFGNIFSSEFASNFEGNFAKAFGNVLTEWVSERGFSIEDVKTLTSWTGAAKGTFGQQTADYVFSALTTGTQGGLNATTQRALRAVNFENSLAGLSQLKNLKNSVTDKSLEQTLNNLYDRMLGDIGGESGLFSKLWNSSDFAKVAASLESVYQQTGTISASLVQALSSKSESLRDYLGATSLSNAGGLAATMRAIYSGTIEQTEVTTSLIQSLGMAYGGTGTQASRQEEIKNFDFEDSSANLINKWLKSAGQGVKAGWNAGYLADPATMQIINMLPQSTQMAYYQSMRGGLSDQFGAKTILQSFKSADPAAATFLTKLQSGKAQIADVMAYLKAETGLFSDTDSLFSWTPNGLVLKGSAKELFGENGEFGEYGQYLKDNYKEFVKPNGELNVEYLFNSAPGYQRLLEDYLKGKIPTKGATSYLDNASSEFWGNMITEWTASGGAAPQWDVEGVANALDNYEMLGFASDAEFRAFVQEAILNNPNPLVRNIAGVDNYDDYVKWFKQNSAGNFQVLSKDYWNKSENLIGDFGKIIGSNYDHFNWLMESEGATLKDSDGNKIGTDFNKAVQVLMSKMDMTRDQAIDALNTYGAVLDHLGGYVYENGTAIFTTYQEWLLAQGKTHSRENLEEFSKLLSDNSIENSIEKYVSDLMAGVKEALGITADTTEVEKQIQNYLNIFGGKGPAAGIGAFLDDVWKESALGRAVQGAVTGVKKFFKGMAEGVINFFTGNNWNYYFDDTVGQGFGTFLQDTFTGIIDDLKDGAPKIAGLISNIFGLGKFENLSMGGQNIFRFTDKDGNQIITDSMSEIWGNIGSILSGNLVTGIGNALSFVDGLLENWSFTNGNNFENWSDVGDALSKFGSQALSKFSAGLADLITGQKGLFNVDQYGNISTLKRIAGKDEWVPASLKDIWSTIASTTWDGIKSFFNETIPNFLDDVNNFIFGSGENANPLKGEDLGDSFLNLGKNILGKALNGLNSFLGGGSEDYQLFDKDYFEHLGDIFNATKEIIIDKLVGNSKLYDYDENGKLLRNGKEATIANVIGDTLDNLIPNINAAIGNTIAGLAGKNVEYWVNKSGKLVKSWVGEDGGIITGSVENFWSEAFSMVGDAFSGLLQSGLDLIAPLFESDRFKYNKDTGLWEYLTDHGELDSATWNEALKGFLGEGSETFLDPINKFLDEKITGENGIINQITSIPNKLQEWLEDSLGEDNWLFDDKNNKWYKKVEGSTTWRSSSLTDAIAAFGEQTLGKFLGSIAPILGGFLGLGEDFKQSGQDFIGAVGSALSEMFKLPEFGESILNALMPDNLQDWMQDYLGEEDRTFLGDIAKGLQANLAGIIDGLTGTSLGTDAFKSNTGFGGIISQLFSDKGMAGFTDNISKAFSETMNKFGASVLDFFSGEDSGYKYVNGKIYRNDQLNPETGKPLDESYGRSFVGVLRDIALDTFAPEGYHAYNGKYYQSGAGWDETTGTPATNPDGSYVSGGLNPTDIAIASFLSSAGLGNYQAVEGGGVHLFDQEGNDLGAFDLTKQVNDLVTNATNTAYNTLMSNLANNEDYQNIQALFTDPLGYIFSGGKSSGDNGGQSGKKPSSTNGGQSTQTNTKKGLLGYAWDWAKGKVVDFMTKDSWPDLKSKTDEAVGFDTNVLGLDFFTPTKELVDKLKNGSITQQHEYYRELYDELKAVEPDITSLEFANYIKTLGYDQKNKYSVESLQGLFQMFEMGAFGPPVNEESASNEFNLEDYKGAYNDYISIETGANRTPSAQGFIDFLKDNPYYNFNLDNTTLQGIYNVLKESLEVQTESLDLANEAAEETSTTGRKYNSETGKWEDAEGNEFETDEAGNDLPQKAEDYKQQSDYSGGGGNGGDIPAGNNNTGNPAASPGGSTQGGTQGSTSSGTYDPGTVAKSISNYFDTHLERAGESYTVGGETYSYIKDEDGGVVGFETPSGEKYDMEGVPMGENNAATGQNNTRILQFASGKEGHMAVTGELGPELTIREDGSVDMLGRRGREYAWVNPGDIIYTAAQTASILGNNNIAWLDGFSKGFNNKIRAYSIGDMYRDGAGNANSNGDTWTPGNTYGGSGGNGSVSKAAYSGGMMGAMMGMEEAVEEDPRYNMYTLKERDIITRYYTILQQLDDITREINYFANQAERSWGQERINAIHRQTEAYEKQLESYLEYQRQVEKYLQTDKSALTQMIEEVADALRNKTSAEFYGGESSNQQRTDTLVGGFHASGYNNKIQGHGYGLSANGTTKAEFSSDGSRVLNVSGTGISGTTGDPAMRTPINWTMPIYDKNGVLTNYEEVVRAMMEIYNENAELFAQDKEAQYKFQEMLKDIQFYTDTLNLYEQNQQVLIQERQQILDNQIREVVYRLELDNELDMNELREINYEFTKIKDSAYDAADRIDYYATKLDYLDKQNKRISESMKDVLAVYSGNVANGIQHKFNFTFYQKAPMEGYLEVEDDSMAAAMMNGEMAMDMGMGGGAFSMKEALRADIGGSGIVSNSLYSGESLNIPGLTTEEKKKLKIDYIDDETGFIYLNDGSWIDPKKKKRYRKKKATTMMDGSMMSGANMISDIGGFTVNKAYSTIGYSDDGSIFRSNVGEENTYTDEYGIKHKTKGTSGNTTSNPVSSDFRLYQLGGANYYKEEDLLRNIPSSNGKTISSGFNYTDEQGMYHRTQGIAGGTNTVPDKADILRLSSGEVVAIGAGGPHVLNSSVSQIEDQLKEIKRNQSDYSLDFSSGVRAEVGPEGIYDFHWGEDIMSGLSSAEEEIEELPYFPSEYEINEYMKNFKKVTYGEETYYVPISDDVEIREDITPAIKLDEIILNNKGELTKDMKDIVTQQVQSWYDELVKLSPQLAVDIVPDYDEQGFMTNYREVMKKINEVNAHMNEEMYQLLLTDPQKFYETFTKITDLNINFENLTTSTIAMFESDVQQLYDNINQGKEFAEAAINELSSYIKQTYKDLQREFSEFDFFEEVLQNYKDIINLTNRQQSNVDRNIIEQLSQVSYGNAVNKIRGARSIYEQQEKEYQETKKKYDKSKADFEAIKQDLTEQGLALEDMKKSYAYADAVATMRNFEKDLQDANSKMEDAEKEMLKSWEDALDKALDKYNTHMDEAARAFQESFNPMFTSIQAFQDQLEREQAIEDLYVNDYQRIHDLSALDRSIEQSILDTDNLKSKTRLRDLQKEINELQESNIKLSAYDLDILNKKYQIELARQALEDAKNAKSVVRLSRDNNGNWSYVYTSDDTEVEEAEQRYENAIRDMEQSTQEYGKAFQSQIGQVTDEVAAQLAAITPDSFNGDREAQQRAKENIMKSAEASLDFIYEQFNKVFGDNGWLGSYIEDIYGKNNHNLYNSFEDTMLGKMPGVGSLDSLINHSLDMLRDYNIQTDNYIEELYNDQREAYDAAGVDIENASEWFAQAAQLLAESSTDQVQVVGDLIEQIDFEFDRLIEKLDQFFERYLDSVRTYDIIEKEILAHNMKELIAIRAEDEGRFRLDFASAVDSYEELEAIKQALAKYGEVLVTDYDENEIQHFYELAEGTTYTAEQLSKWFDVVAKGDAIDIDKDLDTREEYDQINKYLEAHGQVYISIDGELKKLSKDNAEDMEWLQAKLTAIEEAEKKADDRLLSFIGDYGGDYGGGGIDTAFYGKVTVDPTSGITTVEYGNGEGYKVNANGTIYDASDGSGYTNGAHFASGGYTGVFADTGMYTGEWPNGSVRSNGRLAWLHQKELVLNAHDTENFLDAMNIVRQLDNLTSWMANGLGDLFSPNVTTEEGTLQQEVHIDASFPNVTDHNEIEEAFGNLVNLASQYANRKAFV